MTFNVILGCMSKYIKRGYPKQNLKIRGENNYNWKGNDVKTMDVARCRARRMFQIKGKLCEKCESKATDRHHKDSNPLNNNEKNISFLCRRCHMVEDGRLERFRKLAMARPALPPRPCSICEELKTIFRYGRCPACSEYFRRNGKERPFKTGEWKAMKDIEHSMPCLRCEKPKNWDLKRPTTKHCRTCYSHIFYKTKTKALSIPYRGYKP